MYNTNHRSSDARDEDAPTHRRMPPFIAGAAEQWILKVNSGQGTFHTFAKGAMRSGPKYHKKLGSAQFVTAELVSTKIDRCKGTAIHLWFCL